jgi:hypothetical protein
MGHSREGLLSLFKNPFYGGAYSAYRTLGETEVSAIIAECCAAWGSVRTTVQDV